LKELIRFKDVIKLLMGFNDLIKDLIEEKIMFGGLIQDDLK
jgi:hypothetical protein